MIIFTLLCLFFGLVTPFSHFTLIINSVVFGLLAQAQIKKFILRYKIGIWLLLGFGYSLIYRFQTDTSILISGLVVFSLFYWLSRRLYSNLNQLVLIVFFCLFIGLLGTALIDGTQLRAQLTQDISPPFMTDMDAYQNSLNLYKETGDFYQSFAVSIQGLDINYGTDQYAGEIWGWKQPLIFTLWKMVPGGKAAGVQWLAVLAFSLILLAAYKIARIFLSPQQALIGPFLIWPYLHYPLVEMTLLQVEWWALVFFFLGFMAYLIKRYWLTGIIFTLCLAVRELFAIPILGLVVIQLLRKRFKSALSLSLPTILVFLPYYYFYHLRNVFQYEAFDLLSGETLRSGALSKWELVRTTLAYNSWSYGSWMIRPFLVLLIINSIGLLLLIILKKKPWQFLSLLTAFLLFFLFSFILNMMDTWHDYWGIYYIPMLLLTTPVVFHYLDRYFPGIFKRLKKIVLK